jgi:acyl-ACP thioesterase
VAGTYTYRVGSKDVDASGRARLCTVGDLVLQAAGDDADMLGFGVSDLNLDNASWVLSRMAVEMRRLPARGETVDVYTWVSDYGRLFTTRNMVLSCDGAAMGAAVTQWAMIDISTRRPLDLSALSNKGTSLVDREPPIEMPRKVTGVSGNILERPYTVVYSDIDFNGHVNSMKYLEWMIDSLPPGEAGSLDALRLDINYLHEARLGEALTICRGDDDGGARLFDIKNAGGGAVCRAAINPRTL